MDYTELLKTFIASATFIGGLSWLAKEVVRMYLSKQVDLYKHELNQEFLKFETKFKTLHLERHKVIKDTYKKLVTVEKGLISLIRPFQHTSEPSQEEKSKELIDDYFDFKDYFEVNRLLFPEATCELIDQIIKKIDDIWGDWQITLSYKDHNRKDFVSEWNETWQKVRKDIPAAKKSIEKEFRALISSD